MSRLARISFIVSILRNAVLPVCCLLAGTGTSGAQKVYHCMTGTHLYELKPGSSIPRDTAVFQLLSSYHDSLAFKMEEVIVENKAPLSKTQPESTLGNWICDAARKQVSRQGIQADICLLSYGCIGKEYIAPGPVYRKDIYELIPFENKMVLVSLSGTVLHHLCDSITRMNGMPLSGLSFTIDSGRAVNIRIGPEALNEHRIYTILVNDYLLGRYSQLLAKLCSRNRNTGLSLRNLLLQECIELQDKGMPVHQVLEKRIAYAE